MLEVLIVTVLLSARPTLRAATPAAATAEYPVQIKVEDSQTVLLATGSLLQPYQQLVAVLGGKKVRLLSEFSVGGLLVPGTYQAKGPSPQKAKSDSVYDLRQSYELLLPDGKTRRFALVGISTTAPNP